MTLDLQDVARAMAAPARVECPEVHGWSVDTRTLEAGDVYFALRGPQHDGHDFVARAFALGASAAVVERASGDPRELVVSDSLGALQELAAWARSAWGGLVVAVTGSAGKTTTKDAIADLLETEMAVGRTVGNLNNHVGVPLSILRLPDGARAAVLELGMNHGGEIRNLAGVARPDLGVVTNVGFAHVEYFESIEGVAAAKRELIEALPRDGVAVLNADDPRVAAFRDVHPGRTITFGFSEAAEVRAEEVEMTATGSRFRALGVDFETGLTGRHGISNLLAAIAVAGEFGIAPERLRDAVRKFTPGHMRGERLEHGGVVVWNDCYNANPEATKSMIDVLERTPASRRIAVLGEMLELGRAAEELHRQVGSYAAGRGIDVVIGVRGVARALAEAAGGVGMFFEDPAEAGEFARRWARPGDAILFKGSRGVKMERALERFLE
jgi:UDP-N-acetylmuramoyl-tripeptide--D-alanyl-D-alanine ligase